jgi:hypothetical protein
MNKTSSLHIKKKSMHSKTTSERGFQPAASEQDPLKKAQSEGVAESVQAKACAPGLGFAGTPLSPHLKILPGKQPSPDVICSRYCL